MNDLSPNARQALAALRTRDTLGAEAKARLHARIGASIAGGAAEAIDPRDVASLEPPVARLDAKAIAIRIALPIGIAAAVLLGLWAIAPGRDAARRESDARAQAGYSAEPAAGATASSKQASPVPGSTHERSAVPTEDATAPEHVADTVAGEPGTSATRGPSTGDRGRDPSSVRSPEPEPAPSDTTLAQEMALLKRARAALREGDATEALAVLDRHADAFATGQMVEDRDALRVEALCAADRTEDARAAAAAFVRARPRSPHAARVQKICKTE